MYLKNKCALSADGSFSFLWVLIMCLLIIILCFSERAQTAVSNISESCLRRTQFAAAAWFTRL